MSAQATLLVSAACLRRADLLVLVANDNDYLPAIQLAREVDAYVMLAYVVANPSDHRTIRLMREAANDHLVIDESFMDGMWLEKPFSDRTEKRW